MDLYEAILKRKSVRKYEDKEIDSNILDEINGFISSLQPIYSDINVKFTLVESKNMPKYFENSPAILSPYYVVITSQSKPWFGENAGYMGEKLIAFLTAKEIGTCWIGTLKPKKSAFELPYVISIAFGYAKDQLFRENLEEINRKPINEICLKNPESDFLKQAVQAIRIAPSGINRQPWRIEPDTGAIHFYCEQPSFLTPVNSDNLKGLMPGAILKRMQGVSCGIAISHAEICASHYGNKVILSRLSNHNNTYKKLTYLISAVIK
ncbi:MAG: nitroreductase family protein [Bacillota bacterium]|nr:nitroreductase family protein [Bacillota bacterium]